MNTQGSTSPLALMWRYRRPPAMQPPTYSAMEILKEHKLPFGTSCCYTSANLDSISSEEFVDQLVEWGAWGRA